MSYVHEDSAGQFQSHNPNTGLCVLSTMYALYSAVKK